MENVFLSIVADRGSAERWLMGCEEITILVIWLSEGEERKREVIGTHLFYIPLPQNYYIPFMHCSFASCFWHFILDGPSPALIIFFTSLLLFWWVVLL